MGVGATDPSPTLVSWHSPFLERIQQSLERQRMGRKLRRETMSNWKSQQEEYKYITNTYLVVLY